MTPSEQALLDEACGSRQPQVLLRTRTRADTGRWWRMSRLWLVVCDDELVVFAVARRKYLRKVAKADCRSSRYCHATGRIVIAPTEELEFPQLSLSPSEALQVLDALGADTEPISQTEPSIHP